MLEREDYKTAKWLVTLKAVAFARLSYATTRNEMVLSHAASRVGPFRADPEDRRLDVMLSNGDIVRLTRVLEERVKECEREAGREERRGYTTTAKIWKMDAEATRSLLIRIKGALQK